ncbi:MAG: S-methyl-5-thioribose-1-phosphate isomerase [Dehalococcoidia bacterium]|nr:S-methyl-5-thioribose-1-phosphate isomerase [Dehalococcoidia bacterium]
MKEPLAWLGNRLRLLDQTRLPNEEVYLELTDYQDVAEAIKALRVRGAPAIGVAAGYAVSLWALAASSQDVLSFKKELDGVLAVLAATRPTARNLFQVIERLREVGDGLSSVDAFKEKLVQEAAAIHLEQHEADRTLADYGAALLGAGASVLTHCNTGPLATAGCGTALGIIIRAFEEDKIKLVYATETRPLGQGARLTAWELMQAGAPFKLITDSMAGYVMSTRRVDAVIVGADRIAQNGDTANKIGTYTLAVLAHEHGIPFYVAAPTTTIDRGASTGSDITIEERNEDEVTHCHGIRLAPAGTEALNPSFDVTPARLITAIITEQGVIKTPCL